MKELLQTIKTKAAELKARLNENLANMPPVEQMSAFPALSSLFSDIKWAQNRLKEIDEMVDEEAVAQVEAQLEEKAAGKAEELVADRIEAGELVTKDGVDEALAAKLEAGEYVAKAEVEAQVTAAVTAAKEEKDTEIAAERQKIQDIKDRREAAAEKHSAEVAAALSDEDVLADDHEARFDRRANRVSVLAEMGIKDSEESREAFNLYCGHPLDEDGEANFEAQVQALKQVTKAAVPGGNQPPKKPSPTGGTQLAAGSPKGDEVKVSSKSAVLA